MPLVRTAKVLLQASRRPRLTGSEESVITLRVWPGDLDMNLHMNNGRYLTLMDLGRLDHFVRTGGAALARRRKWFALVGASTIRYRRSLQPFERFRLRTRLVGWDEKWFYMEQRFETMDGTVAAVGLVKALLRGGRGNVPTAEVMRGLGVGTVSPPLPEHVARWAETATDLALAARAPAP